MNIVMNYENLKACANENGLDYLMKVLDLKYDFNFYAISNSWLEDRRYICKLKGLRGDMIVLWEVEN